MFEVISSLIGNYAFPICISIVLLYINEMQDKRHTESLENIRKTVENNTLAITKLMEKMEDDKK